MNFVLSDFNHWLCASCLKLGRRKEKALQVVGLENCCRCGDMTNFGVIVREHPKSPILVHCKGVHSAEVGSA